MSWTSASVGPSGRQIDSRSSTDAVEGSNLFLPRSAKLASWSSSLQRDVEVRRCRSRSRSAVALRSTRTARACSGACRGRPTRFATCQATIACADGRGQLAAEELVDAAHLPMGSAIRSRWCTSTNRSSPMRARAAMACSTPTRRWFATSRPSRCRSRCPSAGGKIVDTMLAHDGTDFTGSRWVITNRASGYASTIASRWKLWCGALNSQRFGRRLRLQQLDHAAVVLVRRRWRRRRATTRGSRTPAA